MSCAQGGFVYFGPDGHVLLINAIRNDEEAGWTIDFHKGQELKSKAVIRILHEQGRLHEVRLEKLLEYVPPGGQLFFAWIHAREFDIEDVDNQLWFVKPDDKDVLSDFIGGLGGGRVLNGAFLYAAVRDGAPLDESADAIYFPIAASPEHAEERMATILQEMSPGRQMSSDTKRYVVKRWKEALLQAVVEGNMDQVNIGFRDYLERSADGSLEVSPECWPTDQSFGETLLHKAARLGHVELVSCLLDHAADWKNRADRAAGIDESIFQGIDAHMWLVEMQTSEDKTPMELGTMTADRTPDLYQPQPCPRLP